MGFISIGKILFGLPKLLFKYWYVTCFIIFVLPAIVQSIHAGYNGDDWGQPLRDGGEYLASQDRIIYDYVETAEYNPNGNLTDYHFNFWKELIWILWKALWGMFFTFMVLYKLIRFGLGNDSKSLRAMIIAILIMGLAQILVAGMPFKGLANLVEFIIYEVIL